MDASEIQLRPVRPGDYEYVIKRLDEWWGGRSMTASLPRLFFDHFPETSCVAGGGEAGEPAGFLVGFRSQADPLVAYIHFVGVDPVWRGAHVGRTMYEWFFERAASIGCRSVKCVTSPVNTSSIAFHRAMGFSAHEVAEYDGLGAARVVFERALTPSA